MANYNEVFRTNYFKVKDIDEFKKMINSLQSEGEVEVWEEKARSGDTLVAIGSYGGCPNFVMDEETEEEQEIDLMEEISGHLEAGWVAVLNYCGNEKLRYLSAGAMAINSEGERESFNLFQFTETIKHLGENCTTPEF